MDGWKTLLGDVAEILRQNRWLACLAGGLCALVVAAVAVSCSTRLAASSAASAEGIPATTEAAAEGSLTDAQREVRESWGDAESALWAELESYRWIAPDGSALAFCEGGWTDGAGEACAAVVSSVSAGAAESETVSDNVEATGTVQVTTFSLLLADGSTTLATLTTVTVGDATTRDLAIDAVSTSKAFTAYSESSELTVADDSGELAALFGGSLDALTESLRSWASTSAPDAASASWDGRSTTDRTQGTVEVTLTLDDSAATSVDVTYAPETGAIDIEGAK